ncbi:MULTISPECIES: RNA polymerase sigma factor [unclassified Rathayibacter]|uniref:RNA polymerase sigma factor n=1 Tax=unclassified Rathayibacter TaxID=2609250 RepID=UPI000CE7561F|nr:MULTISPECIES: RNA polymerase sigma factor [unclassified Rathayibacter]PPF23598.1 RNA polymerase subunit sigma-24 [Rathayibacter sp. AY1F2]PPG49553.1 RNA polymerase subunit sigma-24 [Rathayibacter sp. AY1E9]PPH38123.1 RNA polymerase subunit sigma-24 [Rathayibacter sp. AY1E4]PPH40671.1 RNA polymerase subunit sigma-24 [Rathayibacter sp. AY1F7]
MKAKRTAVLEAVYLANASDLLSYFERRVSPVADAADLLSDTYLVAWRKVDSIPTDPEQARMWLFGVARRTLANAQRGNARRSDLAMKLAGTLRAMPLEEPTAEHLDVRRALDAIAPDQAELIKLVLWDGFTVIDAGRILGLSASTARGRYQRARTALRELLTEKQLVTDATS